jgi:hypothetical protein
MLMIKSPKSQAKTNTLIKKPVIFFKMPILYVVSAWVWMLRNVLEIRDEVDLKMPTENLQAMEGNTSHHVTISDCVRSVSDCSAWWNRATYER